MPDWLPDYAELHALSNFTFLRGASSARELFERAKDVGYTALAITDECTLAGIVRAYEAAKDTGVKLIVGSELALADGPRLVLLAATKAGYTALCALITTGRRAADKGTYKLTRADLEHLSRDGLLALLLDGDTTDDADAAWLGALFPQRCWVAVELHRGGRDVERLAQLSALGERTGLPLVASGDVHMHVRKRKALQDVLTATRLGTTVAEAGKALFPNGERHLRPRDALAALYPPELLAATLDVAARCTFTLAELRYEYPRELVPDGVTATQHLRALTEAGLATRFPGGASAKVRAQVEHELALIEELKYESYFLTVHDIVAFARSQNILCQGRGSAANSAVCFALGVTEVDPARMNMLFERFISRERNEPPDIDIDFEHERREEVIQYIYRKYGRHRAALAATVICYRGKSAVRDVGKALGMSLDQVDSIAKTLGWWDGAEQLTDRLVERGFDPASPLIRKLLRLTVELVDFPRHLSQHVGGFVISEHPLSELVPVENAAMPDRTVIQWDKDDLDTLGLLKVDCLALGMLTCLHRCLDLVQRHRGVELTLATIPAEDAETYAMIQQADTLGTFQIESRAQMSMLPRLKPATFYDLVIEIAIVRPGPVQGKMVHPFLRRRQGREPVVYPNEALRDVFGRTLGVPIFQEQVMQLAIVAAGFSPGEADQLRRSMAAWKRRGGMEHFQRRITEGMTQRGYTAEFAAQVFEQIQGFASYGFPESHSASFALIAYASCWLKRHEPAAFACALLNSQPMGFYAPAQIVQDVKRHGVRVLPVDVRYSEWDCTLETDKARALPGRARGHDTYGARFDDVANMRVGAPHGRDRSLFQSPRDSVEPEKPRASRAQVPTEHVFDACSCEPRSLRSELAHGRDTSIATFDDVTGWSTGAPHPADRDIAPFDDTPHRAPDFDAAPESRAPTDQRRPAPLSLRLGLRQIRGVSEDLANRLVAARAQGPFDSVQDLAERAGLNAFERTRLADAGALRGLAGHRHRARWAAAGAERQAPLFAGTGVAEDGVQLAPPSTAKNVWSDYEHLGLSLDKHPLALLRRQLAARRVRTAAELRHIGNAHHVRTAGLVTIRQRPATASGVTFVTMEDETGTTNIVVWRDLGERCRQILNGARLLGVDGKLELVDGVQHVIAAQLHDYSPLLGSLDARSRDFR